MIKGLYAAASAMLANVNLQSILAHNTSNMDTPGLKQVMAGLDDFTSSPVLYPPHTSAENQAGRYIGNVGLGVETRPEETDFAVGPLQATGNSLDLAIQGPGFFRVQTPDGEGYTRDGRFALDAAGQLVTVDGYYLLDTNGQPLRIEGDGPVTISGNGTLYVDGQEAGQVGVAAFANPRTELRRTLPNVFTAAGQPTGEETGVVVQGYLEASNVNAALVVAQMTKVARHYEAAQQMVQNQDELLGRSISTLGSF